MRSSSNFNQWRDCLTVFSFSLGPL